MTHAIGKRICSCHGGIGSHKVPMSSAYISMLHMRVSNILAWTLLTWCWIFGRVQRNVFDTMTVSCQAALASRPLAIDVMQLLSDGTDSAGQWCPAVIWDYWREHYSDLMQWMSLTRGYDHSVDHATAGWSRIDCNPWLH